MAQMWFGLFFLTESQQTTSQAHINRHFSILHENEDPDLSGDERPILQPLTDEERALFATQR